MRQKAFGPVIPKMGIEPFGESFVFRDDEQPPAFFKHTFGNPRQHAFDGGAGQVVEIDLHRPSRSTFEILCDKTIEKADAIASRALVPERAGFGSPDHAGNVEMRPANAIFDKA